MNSLSPRISFLIFLSFVATVTCAFAQLLPEKEEDIPVEYIPTLDTTVSIGMHRLNNGPRVRFGNLGMISNSAAINNDTGTNFLTHTYSNGTVSQDGFTSQEVDINGVPIKAGSAVYTTNWTSVSDGTSVTVYNPISTAMTNSGGLVTNSDGTYIPNTTPATITNSDGTTTVIDTTTLTWASTSKFLAYNANQTRYWNVARADQINQGKRTVSMSTYSVSSAGTSLEAQSNGSTGIDLTLERRLGKQGHLEWGVSGGFKLVMINAKAQAVIPAYLMATTDIYTMVDTGLNKSLSGGTVDITQPNGLNIQDLLLNTYNPSGTGNSVYQFLSSAALPLNYTVGADLSTATPLNVNNVTWGKPTVIGTAFVHGNYELKGAYYLAHIGPNFRYRFNDRWAISGTAGLALAYVGTEFKASESFNTGYEVDQQLLDNPDLAPTYSVVGERNSTHKFIPGFYYDFNAEYWVTERTGFYIGATGQSMRSFQQNKLSGRTATIDLGKSAGWRIGVMTRF